MTINYPIFDMCATVSLAWSHLSGMTLNFLSMPFMRDIDYQRLCMMEYCYMRYCCPRHDAKLAVPVTPMLNVQNDARHTDTYPLQFLFDVAPALEAQSSEQLCDHDVQTSPSNMLLHVYELSNSVWFYFYLCYVSPLSAMTITYDSSLICDESKTHYDFHFCDSSALRKTFQPLPVLAARQIILAHMSRT